MKAHINGITIEGTPQEIMEYQRLQEPKARFKEPLAGGGWGWSIFGPHNTCINPDPIYTSSRIDA